MNYIVEIEIDQPREKVIELFDSAENLAFWQPGFVSHDHLSGDPGTAGAKTRLCYKNRGRDVELIETITVANFPDEFSATFEAKGMHIAQKNTFTESGEGKTKWVSENEAKVSGIVMRIFALLMPGCFRKESLKYMTNFKAFAETGADIREAG